MDRFYKYNDFIARNTENKKTLGYKIQTTDGYYLTVNKVRVVVENKKQLDDLFKKIENPTVLVSGEGHMTVSVLVNGVMSGHLVISNATYLKNWKGFN